MELNKAILAVSKVCALGKKGNTTLQFMRFISRATDQKSLVYATDGVCTYVALVDVRLPDAMLDAHFLVKAAKDHRILEVHLGEYGKMELRTNTKTYSIRSENWDMFPGIPDIPELKECTQLSGLTWNHIHRVVHAAELAELSLAVLKFAPGVVEATDKIRLARVEVPIGWEGLVPVRVFQGFPNPPKTGLIYAKFSSTHAYFWSGDVLRIAALQHGTYPATKQAVPLEHDGSFVLVNTRDFDGAVVQGFRVSKQGLVHLDIDGSPGSRVLVRAWQDKGIGETYEARIPILHRSGEKSGMALLNGKYLHQALAGVFTPNVKLSYGGLTDPIRVESGVYVACLWQMIQ